MLYNHCFLFPIVYFWAYFLNICKCRYTCCGKYLLLHHKPEWLQVLWCQIKQNLLSLSWKAIPILMLHILGLCSVVIKPVILKLRRIMIGGNALFLPFFPSIIFLAPLNWLCTCLSFYSFDKKKKNSNYSVYNSETCPRTSLRDQIGWLAKVLSSINKVRWILNP